MLLPAWPQQEDIHPLLQGVVNAKLKPSSDPLPRYLMAPLALSPHSPDKSGEQTDFVENELMVSSLRRMS